MKWINSIKNLTRRDWIMIGKNSSLMLIGSMILALFSVIFLVPANIVAGGVTGIAIIIDYFMPNVDNILGFLSVFELSVYILNIILFVVGLIFLGKKFALNTLISSIAYPLFITLFTNLGFIQDFASIFTVEALQPGQNIAELNVGLILVCAIFGGLGSGLGVAITFLGAGSTGGTDVLMLMGSKYLHLNEGVASFIVDGIVILLGMILMQGFIVSTLLGVISVITFSLMINYMYSLNVGALVADVVTVKPHEISDQIIGLLDRTTTIIKCQGAYTKEEKYIVRFVFSKREILTFRSIVTNIDKDAFISIHHARVIYGEGFKELSTKKH